MDRSTTFKCKFCVPTCKNTTTYSRNKVFVHVREALKRRWSQETNIEFTPGRRQYYCEDHLNLQEDLENYHRGKVSKGKASLKLTAKLRVFDEPTSSKYLKNEVEGPTLKALLLKPMENFINVDKENIVNKPTAISTSTHPVIIDAATKCGIDTKNKSTSTMHPGRGSILNPFQTSASSSSCCDSQYSPTPSLYGCTLESESTCQKNQLISVPANKYCNLFQVIQRHT